MFTRWPGRLLLLVMILAPGLQAQIPLQPQPAAPAREEASDDPLGRSTPRGTVLGFIKAVEREDYDQAVNYLDTKQHGDLARELAQQLKIILDRETSIDLGKLSARPEGDPMNNKNPNRDLVGVTKTSTGSMGIYLDRVQRGDNPPIWLFSKETLQRVPETYQDIGTPAIERHLPDWLKAKPFLSLPLWRWGVALISIPLILLLGSLFGRLLRPLLGLLARRFIGGSETDQLQGFSAPLRLVLFGILFAIGAGYSYTLLGRQFWRNLGTVLIVVGAVWLLTRLINMVGALTIGRLKRLQASDKIALAGLLARLSQIVVFTLGALIILYLAGVNLTAALTGLGIGGLAVAFAAQKTLENLFGGIMIIWDRPVRIGDACRIGDVTGMVVDIGLRSTRIRTPDRTIVTIPNGQLATMNLENYTLRDKFWFHPTIALRYETTVDQVQMVLEKTREMLDKHANVESETARVRLIRLGNSSHDVEVFAYIFAAGYAEFLAIQEDLLLRILEIVDSAGTALALPTQTMYVVQDSEVNARRLKEKTPALRDR
ncbi:MAG: mechanosensitive ion channel family protein [Candidatus Acidiferrales bacterium]|jgi:MscS family membrane protein